MRKARKMAAFRNRVELSVTPLECRRLLSISASYIGQAPLNEDGALHDTVSFTTSLVSDGIADYCITVTGLDLTKTIQYWVVSQRGGGIYSTGGVLPSGVPQGFAADLQYVGSDVNLYFEPGVANTVNTVYDVTIGYTDGTSDAVSVQPNNQSQLFNPSLRMPGAAVQVSWIGQQEGVDLTGPDAGVGPDGVVDDEVVLSNLSNFPINYVTITGPAGSGLAWETSPNPDGYAHAEMFRPQNSTTANVYFNPYVINSDGTRVDLLNSQSLTVTVHYNIFNVDEEDTFSNLSLTGATTDPNRAVPQAPPSPTLVSVSGVQVTWDGQDGQNLTGGSGDVHIALTGLPAGKTMTGVELSDPALILDLVERPGLPADLAERFDDGRRGLPADPQRGGRGDGPPHHVLRRLDGRHPIHGRVVRRREAARGYAAERLDRHRLQCHGPHQRRRHHVRRHGEARRLQDLQPLQPADP